MEGKITFREKKWQIVFVFVFVLLQKKVYVEKD